MAQAAFGNGIHGDVYLRKKKKNNDNNNDNNNFNLLTYILHVLY